ncbi:MAG: toprim domain-containing protein [Hydrogenophaga sp.]|nr:toprim domain-containing protein [Hydrogenophaga sp.]
MTEAQEITASLGGHWNGHYGTAACPVCQSERRKDQTGLTLSNAPRGLLLHCKKSGCSFTDVLRAAGVARKRSQADQPFRSVSRVTEDAATSGHAEKLWQDSVPIQGTAAEVYLRHIRKIEVPPPKTLRFNAKTWHSPSRQNLPAMIAMIEGGSEFAVSRTFLRSDGSGKADLHKGVQKMMLGGVKGGHVTLQTGSGALVVAEGVETALSLPCLLDFEGATIWAALTAANLRAINLPSVPGKLTIATDGDEAGRNAGECLAARAHRVGWKVEFKPAPEGRDWNDVLREKVANGDGGRFAGTARAGGVHGV